MYEYERTYKTGRVVTSWLELAGWIIVVFGVILALAGFASGGFIGMIFGNLGNSDSMPVILRFLSMIPGIVVAAGGLSAILLAQHAKAVMDTSEMTRELLAIARGQAKLEKSKDNQDQFTRTEPRVSRYATSVGPKQK